MPYRCTYLNCPSVEVSPRREHWITHEKEEHGGREDTEYEDREGDGGRNPPISPKSRTECPFCKKSMNNQNIFHDHLAGHLEYFAALAIPEELRRKSSHATGSR